MQEAEGKVIGRLQALCSRREYCSADVYAKALRALDGDAAAAGRVLDALRKDRFVDDLRYASSFAREKSRLTGWGPLKIRHALTAKGIAAEVQDEALRQLDPEETSRRMQQVLAAKSRLLARDPARKEKLLRFAQSRGYLYGQVSPLLGELLGDGGAREREEDYI